METNDTPRTDEAIAKFSFIEPPHDLDAKFGDFAKQLEMELSQQVKDSAKTLGMALKLNLDLQNKADMWMDEFETIKAIEFSKLNVIESEIAGICDRAMLDIRSRVSLIDQREKVAEENADLEAEIAELNQRLAEKDARIKALSGALDDAISLLDRAVMEETPDDYGETYQAVSDVLAGKALAPKNPA